MYTLAQIDRIRDEAIEADLEAQNEFWVWSSAELKKVCNGCGNENLPEKVRELLTWVYRYYPAGHCIHDVDYELADGTQESFHRANDRFNRNNMKLWKIKYGKARYIIGLWGLFKLKLAYKAVEEWGWGAWSDCFEKNKQK